MFRNVTRNLLLSSTLLITACGGGGSSTTGGGTTTAATIEEVGQLLFEDTNLSAQRNQSCATCHDSTHGFADPMVDVDHPVSAGSNSTLSTPVFGDRNAPTAAYAQFTPTFKLNCTDSKITTPTPCGGQFLDGRADTLEEQAAQPFSNPLEMATTPIAVVNSVENSAYAEKFKAVFGANIFSDPMLAFQKVTEAIAAYERTDEFAPFDSKFDCFLKDDTVFTQIERDGFTLFTGQANCSTCHTIPTNGDPILFTNHMYFNIGVPKNPNHPMGSAFTDHGLMKITQDVNHDGLFKTPTLRNIAVTSPYMHNGVFETLTEVVQFYLIDDRESDDVDVDPRRTGIQRPEVVDNITQEVNNRAYLAPPLASSDYNIRALVAFMETLTDGSGKGICF